LARVLMGYGALFIVVEGGGWLLDPLGATSGKVLTAAVGMAAALAVESRLHGSRGLPAALTSLGYGAPGLGVLGVVNGGQRGPAREHAARPSTRRHQHGREPQPEQFKHASGSQICPRARFCRRYLEGERGALGNGRCGEPAFALALGRRCGEEAPHPQDHPGRTVSKVVITAVMRKLLLLAWTLLRTGQPFSPTGRAYSWPMPDSQDGIPTAPAVTGQHQLELAGLCASTETGQPQRGLKDRARAQPLAWLLRGPRPDPRRSARTASGPPSLLWVFVSFGRRSLGRAAHQWQSRPIINALRV
jgi:hypothetical protein